MRANRRAVRVYDAEDIAVNMRETFQDAPVQYTDEFAWDWPTELQCVGLSLAVGYSSDKWQDKGDTADYKHLAESTNFCFCVPGLIRHDRSPGRAVKVIGPTIDWTGVPMPKHFAILGLFLLADLQLYTKGTDEAPKVGRGDAGVMEISLKHGMLGASKIRWSKKSGRKDQPFLFVYTEQDGPLMIISGGELDVEKDGIVG